MSCKNQPRPGELLSAIWDALVPGGVVFLTVPSIEAWPVRFFNQQWTEYRPENRYFFSPNTLQSLLLKNGFAKVDRTTDRRKYTLSHIYERASRAPQTIFTRLIRLGYKMLPPLRNAKVRITSSGIILSAVKTVKRERPMVSIVLPVYNERETFKILMDSLLGAVHPGRWIAKLSWWNPTPRMAHATSPNPTLATRK